MNEIINAIPSWQEIMSDMGVNTFIALMAMVTAITSTAIALTSVLLTFCQYRLSRKHNILSVKPHIHKWIEFTKDTNNHTICMNFTNKGIGPAIVKGYSVFYEDQKIGSSVHPPELIEEIKSKISTQGNAFPDIHIEDYTFIYQEFILSVGENKTLVSIEVPVNASFSEKHLTDFMNKFRIDFLYECMYGTQFTL